MISGHLFTSSSCVQSLQAVACVPGIQGGWQLNTTDFWELVHGKRDARVVVGLVWMAARQLGTLQHVPPHPSTGAVHGRAHTFVGAILCIPRAAHHTSCQPRVVARIAV